MKFIQTEKLSYLYSKTSPPVLDNLDFSVEKGEFVAVLGHNGSGKSTLAKHLNALLLPSEGKVFIDGLDTSDPNNTYEIRRRVGLVLQNPDNQIVASIVEDDVAFGAENLGIPSDEIRSTVNRVLEAVGMQDYKEHATHKLSGGQKQRVSIAGILAMNPTCIVLDEPTAMLDPSGREEVMQTITRLNRENGITIVLITHYMNEAVNADRVVVMKDGKILTEGTPSEVFGQVERMQSAGLDVPQVSELAFLLRNAGVNFPENILRTEECAETLISILGEIK